MKRTNTALKSVAMVGMAIAITAGPAAASAGPSSVASITGSGEVSQPQLADYSSINSKLNAPVSQAPVSSTVAAIVGSGNSAAPQQADYSSINATLNTPGSKVPVHSTVASIVGAPAQPAPDQAVTVVREDNGFSWTAAFVGAAGALLLALLSLATVRALRRREGVTAA
jgi:hypothetical protein